MALDKHEFAYSGVYGFSKGAPMSASESKSPALWTIKFDPGHDFVIQTHDRDLTFAQYTSNDPINVYRFEPKDMRFTSAMSSGQYTLNVNVNGYSDGVEMAVVDLDGYLEIFIGDRSIFRYRGRTRTK